jgi:hypothetical protein
MIRGIKVYTDFKILQVKVPIIFFGTPVFSARVTSTHVMLGDYGPSEGVSLKPDL